MKIFETNSLINGKITVYWELGWGKIIKVGGLTQSGGILFEVWQSTLRKLQKTKPEVKNCLILGLGGGSVAKIVSKNWPNSKITGVDIDFVMVDLGKKYLGLNKIDVKVKIADAYNFVNAIYNIQHTKYDLVLVDLYCGDKFPEKFEEEKFLKNIKKIVNKDGIVVFNRLFGKNDKDKSLKFGKKLERVFKKVDYFYPQANVELICYN